MPFIPHTDADVAAMLATIGVADTSELFDEIPAALRIEALQGVPAGLTEAEITALMQARAARRYVECDSHARALHNAHTGPMPFGPRQFRRTL